MTKKEFRVHIYYKTGGKCAYCGDELELSGRWHIEHVIPKSRCGSNNEDNLVASCRPCNRTKKARTPDEFRSYLAYREREKIGDAGIALSDYIIKWGDLDKLVDMWNMVHDLQRMVNDTPAVFHYDFANNELA